MRPKFPPIILFFAVLKFALPFLLQNSAFELHRDEYLYYEQGQHLDFGYLENPSLIGLMGYISSLFGGSFFWIKFWPSLFGSLTLLITAAMAKEMGGNIFAQAVASLGILFTAYLRIHFLFQPNFLDIFFWSLSAYFLMRFINTKRYKYIYLLSIAMSLGWWSKYSVLFFITALFISLLLTPYRKLLLQKHFWLATTLALLIIAPNIIWQYYHNWPLVHHMSELQETQLQYINKADFIKEQFIFLLPFLVVWLGGLIWLLHHAMYRMIAFIYLTIIILLMLGSGKGYYALGAYPMLIAAGSVWLEKMSLHKLWLRYAVVSFILLLSLPAIPVLMPMQSPTEMVVFNQKYGLDKLGLLKWEDQQIHPLQQDFADMQGWKELSGKAKQFFNQLPDTAKANTVVYCRNYGQAGALKYYGDDDYFTSKVICDNGTFLLWIQERLYFKNLLFIGRDMPKKDDEVFQYFERVTLIDSVTNSLSRQYGDKIIYFQNASDSAWILANKGLREMKSVFGQ